MQDGLYFNDTWVAEVDAVLNLTANDLTKPDSLEASYSNSFSLPDTLLIRNLLENAEQIDAGGKHPYQQIPAKLIDEGAQVFSGIVELISFEGGWKVNLLDGLVSFFDSLSDKKLSDLDLSNYNHPWTFDGINHFTGSREGVSYPLIDYGGIDGAIVPYDTMCPAVFCKTIAQKIINEAGFRAVGNWLDDPLFLKMALPFVNDHPKSHNDEWKEDRTARVTANKGTELIKLESGHPIDLYLPLNFDNLPIDGFTDGKANCFDAQRATYVCPENMYLNVQAGILFFSQTKYGAAELRLIVERNGMNAAEAYWSQAGLYDHLDEPGDSLSLDETIQCRKGDEIRIRLTGSSRTNFSNYSFYFSQAIGEMWASFTPDTRIHFGDDWLVAQNLPEMNCQDFMVSLAKMMCGSYSIDPFRRRLTLIPFNDIVANVSQAADWSNKTEETQEPVYTPSIEGYGQRNLCQWKELDETETRRDKVTKLGYGDGVLVCEARNTTAEVPLFELPFSACADSQTFLAGYGNPILIKTRIVKGTGDTRSVEAQSTNPRIILVEYDKIIPVVTQEITPEGAIRQRQVTLTPCWWGIRPVGAKTENNAYCLSFSLLPGGREQWLLDRYFKGLLRVLRRPRTLLTSIYLQPEDVASIDLSVPVRLKQVRLGSLNISDNYFYVNSIKGYQSGKTAQVTLIVIM